MSYFDMKTHAAFNELSVLFDEPQNESEAIVLLEGMIKTFKALMKLGFNQLRVNDSFLQQKIVADLTIADAIAKLEKDAKQIWYKLLSSPHISVDEDAVVQTQVIKIEGREFEYPEGIVYALVDGTLAVSFDKPFWRMSKLRLELLYEEGGETRTHELPHVSAQNHITEHIVFASRVTTNVEFHLSPVVSNPLPNKSMSDMLAQPDWRSFYGELSSMNVQQKTASLRTMAEKVAFVNGYQYSVELSSLNQQRFNSLRQIFKTEFLDGRKTVYLSTDFENSAGAFEVCDHRGRHCGEWLFSGIMNKSPDEDHRILLE